MSPPRRLARVAAAVVGAAAAAFALHGCPLPQPLTEVARVDGGTITPPRIYIPSIAPTDTVVKVSRTCPQPATFVVTADLLDDNLAEAVEARWFVDYAPDSANARIFRREELAGTTDPAQTDDTRHLSPVTFVPGDFGEGSGLVHVLEVVVSNGFYPEGTAGLVLPNRTPQDGYETQSYRWVFQYVDAGGRCQTAP